MIEKTNTNNNKYQFAVKSLNGGLLMKSKWYHTENELDEVLVHISKNADYNKMIERTTNHKGQFQFHLKNEYGQVIGSSEPYFSEAGMENGTKNLIRSILAIKLT